MKLERFKCSVTAFQTKYASHSLFIRLQPYVRLYYLIRSLSETSPSAYQFLTARELKTVLGTPRIVDNGVVYFNTCYGSETASFNRITSNHLRELDFITCINEWTVSSKGIASSASPNARILSSTNIKTLHEHYEFLTFSFVIKTFYIIQTIV